MADLISVMLEIFVQDLFSRFLRWTAHREIKYSLIFLTFLLITRRLVIAQYYSLQQSSNA